MIPYGRHCIAQDDIDAVVDVLKNKFLTQGELVPEFERAIASFCDVPYCVAVNSGTSALHIACLALGVGEGDIVWTSPISFVASANCAIYCGAQVDFIDIDAETKNISIEALKEKLKNAEREGTLPKAVIAVHFAGLSCDMEQIHALLKPYGIAIIEDACHAFGGYYKGNRVGYCQFSDICVLSFHPVKSMTTAEGGALLTNNAEINERSVLAAKHGITRDAIKMAGRDAGAAWYYEQTSLGYNYRLSDVHAALGLSQLTKLDTFISLREQKARAYSEQLSQLPIKLPVSKEGHAWHLYVIELLAHDRKLVFDQLRDKGIGVNVHYIPIHTQPYYQQFGFLEGDFVSAESYYERAISIPIYPSMTDHEQRAVVNALADVLS